MFCFLSVFQSPQQHQSLKPKSRAEKIKPVLFVGIISAVQSRQNFIMCVCVNACVYVCINADQCQVKRIDIPLTLVKQTDE